MVLGHWPRQATSKRLLWNRAGGMGIDFAVNCTFTCRFGTTSAEVHPLLYLPRPVPRSGAGKRPGNNP